MVVNVKKSCERLMRKQEFTEEGSQYKKKKVFESIWWRKEIRMGGIVLRNYCE